jgi:UDP-N-acetylmuramate-alanine ligase
LNQKDHVLQESSFHLKCVPLNQRGKSPKELQMYLFLKLHPNVIAITAMDPDHLDIYGTAEEMEKSFIEFTGNLKEGGLLITRKGLKREQDLTASHHITYHLENIYLYRDNKLTFYYN